MLQAGLRVVVDDAPRLTASAAERVLAEEDSERRRRAVEVLKKALRNRRNKDKKKAAKRRAASAEPDAAPATDSRPLKVYLLPVPRTLTDDVLECYRQRRGAYPWDESRPHGNCEPNVPRRCEECARGNGCSSSLAVESAQHASDIWMHQGLLNHGSRTHNDSEADVIFIPFYGAP